ncbi:MAG: DUF2339 domain-containing protein [Actinomycetota bacterium]
MDEFTMQRTYGNAAAPKAPEGPPPSGTTGGDEREVDAVATWFARIGAGLLLLAAGFAYSYAVDRGLITPPVRVALGVLVGTILVLASEASRRRDWPALAQSVAGAGVGVWYLSTWAAYERYDMIPGPAAFGVLALVAAAGVGLAWRHDSEVLAGLATAGAFLVPFLVANALSPLPVLGYVAVVDAAILLTVTLRPWRFVGRVAFFGTWIFAAVSLDASGPGAALVYGGAYWFLFGAHPALRAALGKRIAPEETTFAVANAFAFWVFAMGAVAGTPLEPVRGALTAGLGASYLGLWAAVRGGRDTEVLSTTMLALGGGLLALAVPIQFEGPAIAAGWTVQAVVLVAVGRRSGSATSRALGVGLMGLALLDSVLIEFAVGARYRPEMAMVSGESLTLLLQVAALHVVARLLRDSGEEHEEALEAMASVGAHTLALLWVAFEALAYWTRTLEGSPESAIQYTLTVAWSAYAAGLLAAGVLGRRPRARLVALGIFGVTISKVVIVDLWLLSAPHRVFAFGALGVLLLACSLLYHRFRAIILEG